MTKILEGNLKKSFKLGWDFSNLAEKITLQTGFVSTQWALLILSWRSHHFCHECSSIPPWLFYEFNPFFYSSSRIILRYNPSLFRKSPTIVSGRPFLEGILPYSLSQCGVTSKANILWSFHSVIPIRSVQFLPSQPNSHFYFYNMISHVKIDCDHGDTLYVADHSCPTIRVAALWLQILQKFYDHPIAFAFVHVLPMWAT